MRVVCDGMIGVEERDERGSNAGGRVGVERRSEMGSIA